MAVHVFGKAIKHTLPVHIGLAQNLFGVGSQTAHRICAKVGIYPRMRMNQLSETQIMSINKELSDMQVEHQLKQKIGGDIRLKIKTKSYAGQRHAEGLPVRGQGTRSNGQTAKKLNKRRVDW